MEKKLRQVTDNIHDTIYLSGLESEFISTPYFYRLHDIYQSSTVYMTFPSNRTKRYEHSVGTMEVASSMLFSAVSNADNATTNELFRYLKKYFKEIMDIALLQSEGQGVEYFSKCKDQIGSLFLGDKSIVIDDLIDIIRNAFVEGCFNDSALDQFQYYPMDIHESDDLKNIENVFLYRCLLQAVRIAALFHDVGHPPYSHIIETVLEELYNKYSNVEGENDWQKKQLMKFKDCLKYYATKDSEKAYVCQTLYSRKSLVKAALHEKVGLSLLQSAINDVIPEIINSVIRSDKKDCCKMANAIYHITVVEFTMAILVEKNNVFKSFHKIIDGFVDADRLDYIMRDSLNSGVDWGKIPYKRVINSAKLVYKENNKKDEFKNAGLFVIAYPKKIVDDIEDLLLVRYKIYARINFHHRCMKTSVALQSSVMELAENFLNSKSPEECINPDIEILWRALRLSLGNRTIRIIQWNDSYLISILHKALVELSGKNERSKRETALKENLEEILLNRKKYYSLLKRGSDNKRFVDKIFEYAQITKEKLNALEVKEYLKYYNNEIREKIAIEDILKKPGCDAIDSIRRIRQLEKAKQSGDIELLCSPLPVLNKSIEESVKEILEEYKDRREIADFKIIINEGKGKTGIPQHKDAFDEIYLYDKNKCETFSDKITLREQLEALENKVLWLYIYFAPTIACKDVNELGDKLIEGMAEKIGLELKERYEELFGNNVE